MTTVAHFTIDGTQSDFDQVLAEFQEDDLVIDETPEYHTLNTQMSDEQLFEVRTSEAETLSQFYEKCLGQQITLTLLQIYKKPDRIEKLTLDGEIKNRQGE